MNTETVVKEEVEVNEECVDKGIQRTFLHISQELYIIIQYTQTYVFMVFMVFMVFIVVKPHKCSICEKVVYNIYNI